MNKLKTRHYFTYAVIASWVLFALVDMWFGIVGFTVFVKITISVFVLLLLLVVYGLYRSNQE